MPTHEDPIDGGSVTSNWKRQWMEHLRARSGQVTDDRLLVAFLYRAMRDGMLSAGDVETLLMDVAAAPPGTSFAYTNGYLACYAIDVANRLAP